MQFHLLCTNPQNFNPGGRPKLPADIREAIKAKAPEALEVLERCLQSDDERIAMQAAQAILDRGYGKPAQTIDANITEGDGPFAITLNCPRRLKARKRGCSHDRKEARSCNRCAGAMGQGRALLRVPVPAFADRFHGGPELVGGLQENFASSCNYIQNPETIDWLRRIPGPFDQEAVSGNLDADQ